MAAFFMVNSKVAKIDYARDMSSNSAQSSFINQLMTTFLIIIENFNLLLLPREVPVDQPTNAPLPAAGTALGFVQGCLLMPAMAAQ
jgi:hypothetical protein